jgi:ATP-dependent DNA ligase
MFGSPVSWIVNGCSVRSCPSAIIVSTTHIAERGRELFAELCAQDLEGIVAKRADSVYDAAAPISPWAKIKNPEYRHAVDRHQLFERA